MEDLAPRDPPAPHHDINQVETASDDDEEGSSDDEHLDVRVSVQNGSFLPAILLLERGIIKPDFIIEPTAGIQIIHFTCYYGKIITLKALIELYKADPNSVDYRGQSPYHVAAASGELKPLVYLSRLDSVDKELKDNSLTTALMYSAGSRHVECFIYLAFREELEMHNLDSSG